MLARGKLLIDGASRPYWSAFSFFEWPLSRLLQTYTDERRIGSSFIETTVMW